MSSDEVDLSVLDEDIDLSVLDKEDDVDLSVLDKEDEVDLSILDKKPEKPEEDSLTLGQTAGSLAIDVGGSIGSQALGYSLAPFTLGGSLVIPFLGGMASNITAQMTAEGKDFDEISYGRALSSGMLNMIPGAAVTKFARPIAREVGKGALMGAADITIQKTIDEKRLPTKEELALGVGIGGTIGGGLGAALKSSAKKKFTQRVEEGDIFGMPIDKVDEAILTTKAEGKELRDIVETATGRKFTEEEIVERAKQLELDVIAQKKRNDNLSIKEGWFGVDGVFSNLTPTLALGPTVRNTIFETRNSVRRANNLALKLPKDIRESLQKGGEAKEKLGRDVNSFLDGKEMSEELKKQTWAGNLIKYREEEDKLYKQFTKLLIARKRGDKIDSFFEGLDKGDEDFLIDKLHRAAKQNDRVKQYKALIGGKTKDGRDVFYPRPEKMSAKDRQQLFDEIKNWQIKNNDYLVSKERLDEIKELKGAEEAKKYFTLEQLVGEDGKSGKILDHMKYLAKESEGAVKLKNVLPGNVERKLGNHVPGPIERNLLGEVRDVGMRMNVGISELGESMARFEGDKVILQSMIKQGLVSDAPTGEFTKPLRMKSLNTGKSFYTTREADRALSIVNGADIVEESNDPLLRNANAFFKFAVTTSKAVKVIFNPPSYAVNAMSGQLTMMGMGLFNPLKLPAIAYRAGKGLLTRDVSSGYMKGAKLALNESDLMNKAGNLIRKSSAENRKAYLDSYDEYVRNGIMNGNIAADDIIETLRAVGTSGGKLQKVANLGKAPFEFFGKMYSVTDIAARASVYEANKRSLQKMFPRLAGPINRRELEKVAAAITNDTYQNYDYVSRIVRRLSRIGVMPQFVTFTAEFARNMYHQGRIARMFLTGDVNKLANQYGISKAVLRDVNKKAFRAEGVRRSAGLATVMGAAAFGPAAWNRSQGIDEEADNDLRKILPSWQRNKSLLFYKNPDKPDEIAVANASYIMPHAIIASAIQAGLDGKDQTSVIGFLTEEFLGTGTFINQEMMRALDNRTARGKQITYSLDDEKRAAELMGYFLTATFTPGFVNEYDKFMDSISGSEQSQFTTAEVMRRQLGLRFNKYNLEEMTKYKLQDLSNSQSRIKGEYSSAYKKFTGEYTGDVVTEQELEEIYQNANEGSAQAYEQMKDVFNAMTRSFGYSVEKATEILSGPGSNISTKNAFRIIKGLDHQDIERVPMNTVAQRYETLFGEDTAISSYSDKQIINKIKSLRKTDPVEFKSMLNYYRSQKRAERGNLTTEDKLLKKMSVADRAEAILSLGYTTREKKKELIRKGIWTKDVEMVIRSMQ